MNFYDGYMPLLQRITAVACYKCAEKEAQVQQDQFGDPWASGQITEVPVRQPAPGYKPAPMTLDGKPASPLEKAVKPWKPVRSQKTEQNVKSAAVLTHLGDIDDCSP